MGALELTGDSVEVRHDCGCGGVWRRVRAGGRECCGMSEWQRGRKAELGGRARVGWLAGVSCPIAQSPRQSNLNATAKCNSHYHVTVHWLASQVILRSRLFISISVHALSLIPSRTYQATRIRATCCCAAAASRLPFNTFHQTTPPRYRQHGGQEVRTRPLTGRR